MVSVDGGTAATAESFVYDGDGRRVKHTAGGVSTLYVYDAFGQLAQEYGGAAPAVSGRSYVFADQLGSTRLQVGAADGKVQGWWDYAPFGEQVPGTAGNRSAVSGFSYGGSTVSVMFTGKVRDRLADGSATGLDYFGARYYSGAQGRFTSVDPAMESADPTNPQSWNRYAYTLNNPLKYVDRNGRWPTDVHNEIILQAFPGLSKQERATLNKASYDTDYNNKVNGFDPQAPEAAFVHGMSDGVHGQLPMEAQRLGDEFIQKNETLAQDQQATFAKSGGQGLSLDAVQSFGNALHTVTDRTSPTHEGNQPWMGTATLADKKAAVKHVLGELSPTPQQRDRAIKEAREAFRKTFGEAAYQRAIQQRKKQEEEQKIPSGIDR